MLQYRTDKKTISKTIQINFACLNLNWKVMDDNVKKAVEEHILKATKLPVKSVGYKAIQRLFSIGELIIWFEYDLLMDIRRGCHTLGFLIKLKKDLIVVDEDVIINYYEKVMKLKYPEQKPELTYYERVKMSEKKGDQ